MTERWFFNTFGGRVHLVARLDSDDTVGDMRSELSEGGRIKNLTYEDLKRAGAGSIVVEGETAKIEE